MAKRILTTKQFELLLVVVGLIVSGLALYRATQANQLAREANEISAESLQAQREVSPSIVVTWPGTGVVLPQFLSGCRSPGGNSNYGIIGAVAYPMRVNNRGATNARLLDASFVDPNEGRVFDLEIRIDGESKPLAIALAPNVETRLTFIATTLHTFGSAEAATAALPALQSQRFRPELHLLFDTGTEVTRTLLSYVTYPPPAFDRDCADVLRSVRTSQAELVASILATRGS